MDAKNVWRMLDLSTCLRLLDTVAATFLRALRTAGHSSHVAFYRSTLLGMSVLLDKVDLADRTLSIPAALSSYVKVTLDLLEDLVSDDVQQHLGRTPNHDQHGSKLALLDGCVALEASELFDQKKLQDVDMRSLVCETAEKCTKMLEELLPHGDKIEHTTATDSFAAIESLRMSYAKHWPALFQHLSKQSLTCAGSQPDHEARIHLGKLASGAPNIHLICSTCGSVPTISWHPIEIHLETNIERHQPEDPHWCQNLNSEYLLKAFKTKALRFYYNEDRVWRHEAHKRGENHRQAQREPAMTSLRTVLQDVSVFSATQRKRLQCILAEAFWMLCDVPSALERLSVDTIWFAHWDQSTADLSHRSPFAQCSWTQDAAQPHHSLGTDLDSCTMMRFGLLLLWLECPSHAKLIDIDAEVLLDKYQLDEELTELLDNEEIFPKAQGRGQTQQYQEQEPEKHYASVTLYEVLQACQRWDDGSTGGSKLIWEKIFQPLTKEFLWRDFKEYRCRLTSREKAAKRKRLTADCDLGAHSAKSSRPSSVSRDTSNAGVEIPEGKHSQQSVLVPNHNSMACYDELDFATDQE